jgi:hypothetical protein
MIQSLSLAAMLEIVSMDGPLSGSANLSASIVKPLIHISANTNRSTLAAVRFA